MSQVYYYYYACSPRKDTRYTLRFLRISLINILYVKRLKKKKGYYPTLPALVKLKKLI